MRQMIYVSAANWELGAEDISAILGSARRHNPAQDVTGMLLYIDLGFLQFLEGPPAGVEMI
ncbi:MAG: BLUF domain-containing protein, partial [Rhizomicrobium sp.]